jgi:hypothetical protein
MELTDKDREEFNALADATLDPGVGDESDLSILRAARPEHQREQAKERRDLAFVRTRTRLAFQERRWLAGEPMYGKIAACCLKATRVPCKLVRTKDE